MKRHVLFFATALAMASLGSAGLATAQSAPAATGAAGSNDVQRAPMGDRQTHHGKRHAGHRGHAMHGGIERMDADADGRVSRAEFDAAMAARGEARAARMAEREKAGGEPSRRARDDSEREGMRHGRMVFDFDAIDANKDGYIVRTEVVAHRDRIRQQMGVQREERFAAAFAAADLNRDGKLSRVEVDEKMPRLSPAFAWMDDNRDGFLSRAELEAGKRR